MSDEMAFLRAKIEARMLNGEPFTFSGLCQDFLAERRAMATPDDGTLIDRTIQKLRKAGKITGERKGRKFIWRAASEA